MKKQLLIGAMLMGAFFTANAQYSTSFEAAEDFELGTIHGQNGWMVTQVDEAGTIFVSMQDVTDAMASDGNYSLQITPDTEYPPQENTVVGASKEVTMDSDQFAISFDILIEVDDDEETDGADFDFYAISNAEELVTARVKFFYQGNIVVLDDIDGTIDFADTGVTWEANTWHNVVVNVDTESGIIVYSIDDTVVYEGVIFAGSALDMIAFRNDNWPGSTAYIDNVSVTQGTAGTEDVLASKFSVYPNPANNVINIANAENILVNGVVITDLNGRTVKNVSYNGVTEAQINVSELAAGMYMMTVSSDKGTMTKKIVKN